MDSLKDNENGQNITASELFPWQCPGTHSGTSRTEFWKACAGLPSATSEFSSPSTTLLSPLYTNVTHELNELFQKIFRTMENIWENCSQQIQSVLWNCIHSLLEGYAKCVELKASVSNRKLFPFQNYQFFEKTEIVYAYNWIHFIPLTIL